MGVIGGVIGAVVGGVIGAFVWALLAWLTNYEVGWIAWGIGGLCGFGYSLAHKNAGPMGGVLAALVAVLAILAGKYLAVSWSIDKYLDNPEAAAEELLQALAGDEEMTISYIADEVVSERRAEGESVVFPPGVDPEMAVEAGDYPPVVWSEAVRRWGEMSPTDRDGFRAEIAEHYSTTISGFQDAERALAMMSERLAGDEELTISFIADRIVVDRIEAGEEVAFPEGVDPETAATEGEYPPEIWAAAVAEWNAMSADEQAGFRQETAEEFAASIEQVRVTMGVEGFIGSFTLMDALFFLFAIATAFRLGRGKPTAPAAPPPVAAG